MLNSIFFQTTNYKGEPEVKKASTLKKNDFA